MQYRKDPLAVGETYHIYSRSISALTIFERISEYRRMREAIQYYQHGKPPIRLAWKGRRKSETAPSPAKLSKTGNRPKLVQIICYCLMPTHIHLILRQLVERGISSYMALILNSYSRYFNTKNHRKGPLWEGRFRDVRITSDEQLLHLTRYIHLNPVTEYLVEAPEEWEFSSYREYVSTVDSPICEYGGLLSIESARYKLFVEDRVDYQRRLGDIKRLLHEETNPLRDRHEAAEIGE